MSIVRFSLLALFLFSLGLFGQSGQLDPTFGENGITSVDVDTSYYSLGNMVVQNDGKIVLTGRWQTEQGWDVYVIRCLPDGEPDTTFGAMGFVRTDLGTFWDEGRAVAVQSDGKILVAAQSQADGLLETLSVVRYEPDGALDTDFGTGGVAIPASPSFGIPSDIALKADGEIVVAGSTSASTEFAVYQFTSAGIPDSTFHINGTFSASLAFGFNVAKRLLVQDDGSLIMAVFFGQAGAFDVGLVRLLGNGSYDPGFGNGGITTINVSPGDDVVGGLGVQSDGSLILAGSTNYSTGYDMFAARFTPSGTLDTGFGTNGMALISASIFTDKANDLLVQADDGILLCGMSEWPAGEHRVALARLVPNGMLDTDFGNSGFSMTPTTWNAWAEGYRIGMQPDGRVIVAAYGGLHPVLLRYMLGDPNSVQENLRTEHLVTVFPNPSSDMITVQFAQGAPSTITVDVLDAGGRIVASNGTNHITSAGSHRTQLSIGELAPGVYTVLFSAKEQRQAMKLVKE